MKLLLDTSAYSDLKRGHRATAEIVRGGREIAMSAVVVGELLYGFRHGSRYARNKRELDAFLAVPGVSFLPVTLETADRFGRLMAALRRKGRPLPTNDVWIAAHVLESGCLLVSSDRHFSAIDNLPWVNTEEEG